MMMTKVDKLIQDFKLLDDLEKGEALDRMIILSHPMNVCARLRKVVDNDDDAICKPIIRRVTKYVGKIK